MVERRSVLGTGHDRAFRLFSVIQDQQSRELSQRHTAKRAKKLHVREEDLKLPCVTDMAACQVWRSPAIAPLVLHAPSGMFVTISAYQRRCN